MPARLTRRESANTHDAVAEAGDRDGVTVSVPMPAIAKLAATRAVPPLDRQACGSRHRDDGLPLIELTVSPQIANSWR